MIVNPQLFNYRLIIGSLVITIVILSAFSYISYNKMVENQIFIEQEKDLVENELSEMISSYDDIKIEKKSINIQLEKAKSKLTQILDSVKYLKPSVSLISEYRSQARFLKRQNAQVLAIVKSLERENKILKEEEIKRIENATSNNKVVSRSLSIKNKTLTKPDSNLDSEKKLIVTNLLAKGVKRITSRRIIDTRYAGKANKFHVCYTILSNKNIDADEKEIYIQILDSKMNVIADKGTVNFGEKSLIYSYKETVDYNNEDLNVCSVIEKRLEDTLDKGVYFITIVHEGETLGKTSIELK